MSGEISDPGWLDPLTATIDFDDGVGPVALAGTVENDRPNATLTFSVQYQYGDNGTFEVDVCGTDDTTTTCATKNAVVANVIPDVTIDLSGQSTYDGVLYNTETIKSALDGYVDNLHFDEAWLPHAAFHEFYKDMHAIGKDRPRPKDAIIFATHSTHKLLAGLSQASQILVQESETRKLDRQIFNEAYLMHTSTSPQYAIIASCDVSAAMMEPPGGTALVEESIIEALDFRRAMRKVDEEWGKDWWFKVWGPERLAPEGIGKREDWLLRANEKWHGFGNLALDARLRDLKGTEIRLGRAADVGMKLVIARKVLALVDGSTSYVDVSVPQRPVAG